ncbi:MAG: DUF885 domain-containing protein [Candidatus Limnocylindrales bacterium]
MTTTRATVDDIASRFWEGFLERQPIYASMLGDRRYEDRLSDPGPVGRERDRQLVTDVLAAITDVDRESLGVEDGITLGMLETIATVHLEQDAQRLHEFGSIDHLDGPQGLPGDLARLMVVDSDEAFEHLLARLAAYPAYMDAHIGNIDEGLASGRTAAPVVFKRTIEQLERMVATPTDESPLVAGLGPRLSDDQRETLAGAVQEHVEPSIARFLAAVRAAAPRARGGDGVWALADGAAVYETAVLASTTLPLPAAELHEYGLEQLEAIDRDRLAIARALGHDDVASLRNFLGSDPANFVTEPDELVELARRQIEHASAVAPRWFGRLPMAACEVRAVEPYAAPEAPAAFYFPPAPDGSRPGIYFINTYEPESRPIHQVATTTYHEAVPGHHFQITIESELEDLHPFRRHGSRLAGVAFTEGWGLYSERLADEMGLFDGPRERLGMLDMQAMRAARLVTDTGIHAFRWTRDEAVDFVEGAGLPRTQAEIEVDRYICWPGQALAYMVGQREIVALREELQARDGDRFDLQAFHDQTIGHGALPLATLRAQLPGWVRPRAA